MNTPNKPGPAKMIPSIRVEDFLKTIVLRQSEAGDDDRGFVPVGEVAATMGVARSAVTGMVKTLAKSKLVEYEPYHGVRLSSAGLQVAFSVLRRHRLLELFLVQMLGMRWDEAHSDADQLERAVPARIIDRIDEILGHPEVNQYGEPIPTSEGELITRTLETLVTCPIGKPVTIRQVTDHEAAFLAFIEGHHLMPGQSVEVEARDDSSDSVLLKGKDDDRITIGMRAAAKLWVE